MALRCSAVARLADHLDVIQTRRALEVVGQVDGRDQEAAAQLLVDQADRHHAHERLAHRRAAQAGALGEFGLDHRAAGLELQGRDQRLDRVVGEVGGPALGRRAGRSDRGGCRSGHGVVSRPIRCGGCGSVRRRPGRIGRGRRVSVQGAVRINGVPRHPVAGEGFNPPASRPWARPAARGWPGCSRAPGTAAGAARVASSRT